MVRGLPQSWFMVVEINRLPQCQSWSSYAGLLQWNLVVYWRLIRIVVATEMSIKVDEMSGRNIEFVQDVIITERIHQDGVDGDRECEVRAHGCMP